MEPTPYTMMMAACVAKLPRPRFPARVRFFRNMGGVAGSLTCVAVGGGGEEPEIVGMALIHGQFHGPAEVLPENRAQVLANFD
jgi:hypothetical protein